MKKLILISIIFLLAACKENKPLTPPETLDIYQIIAYVDSGKARRCDTYSSVRTYVIKDSRFADSLVYYKGFDVDFKFLDYKKSK